jgi:hypothetical protein
MKALRNAASGGGWFELGGQVCYAAAVGKVARMHWFRAQRAATWLALFALACQLALTFGHVHLDRPGAPPDILATARSGDAHSTAPASSLPTKPESGIGDL